MLKKIVILGLLITTNLLFSEIIGVHFSNEEFAEDTYVIRYNPEEQRLLEPELLQSHRYNYGIEDLNKNYLIRYILFSETPEVVNQELEFSTMALTSLLNIHGSDEYSNNTSAFRPEDVKNEFNADMGFTNFAVDIKSDYAGEYKFIMTNYFYKKGIGVMCQTIQFNDIEFTKTEKFFEIFHGFNFY